MLNAALYFSHSWKLSNELALTDGLRLGYTSLHSTFVDTSFFHFPFDKINQKHIVYSGSIGLVHTPTDDLKLSLLLSSGFRVPNVDDLSKVFESAPGKIIVPNNDLKPEKTINYELGIEKIFNKKTVWENSIYYTDFIDGIVTSPYLFNGKDSILYQGSYSQVLSNQNQRKAYLFGISTNIKSYVSDCFSLQFQLNYTYGRIKTDSVDVPLDHIPPLSLNLKVGYVYKHFNADFFINYNSKKKITDYYLNGEDNEQYATPEGMPAWLTANLHLTFNCNKYIAVKSGIDNIFDTQYRTFASGINAPGRNLFISLLFNK
jgi:hemoglobin/transferrin/lactoferrin receptor protein